jgi:hypothetical protein
MSEMTNFIISSKDFYFFGHIQQINTAALKTFDNQLIKIYWQIEGGIEIQAQYDSVNYVQD